MPSKVHLAKAIAKHCHLFVLVAACNYGTSLDGYSSKGPAASATSEPSDAGLARIVKAKNETQAGLWVQCDGDESPRCDRWIYVDHGVTVSVHTPNRALVLDNHGLLPSARFANLRVVAPWASVTIYANPDNPFEKPGEAITDTQLGGMKDLHWTCRTQYDDTGARALLDGPIAGPLAAYGWRCALSDLSVHPMDLHEGCRYDYENPKAYARPLNADDAYTWYCYERL